MDNNDWIDQYKQFHADQNTNYPGNNLKPQLQHILDLIKDMKPETLLDFGCGKGQQYYKWKHHEDMGIMPTLYDPAVPEFETLPDGPFDGIISTDVLEHIPEEQIPETINMITKRADKFVFLAIATSPAIAILPNGKNAHCTRKPISWWTEMYEKYSYKRVYTHIKTYGDFNGYSILNEDLYMEYFLNNLKLDKKTS